MIAVVLAYSRVAALRTAVTVNICPVGDSRHPAVRGVIWTLVALRINDFIA